MNKKVYVSLLGIVMFLSSLQVEAKMTKEAHALYQEACSYEYKGDYVNAISIIQKAININGDDAMLYTKIAGLYEDAGNYEEAEKLIKEAEECLNDAHKAQTSLLQKEAIGEDIAYSITMMHGQDHLMTAILLQDLMRHFMELYKRI